MGYLTPTFTAPGRHLEVAGSVIGLERLDIVRHLVTPAHVKVSPCGEIQQDRLDLPFPAGARQRAKTRTTPSVVVGPLKYAVTSRSPSRLTSVSTLTLSGSAEGSYPFHICCGVSNSMVYVLYNYRAVLSTFF